MSDQFPRQRKLPEEKSQIVGFRWNELSGVDHGANLEDDFLIIKSEEGSEALEAMIKSELEIIHGEQALFAALNGFNSDIEGTPTEVKQAADTLRTWLAEQGYDELLDAAAKPNPFAKKPNCTKDACDPKSCPGESCDMCDDDMCKVQRKPVEPTRKDDGEHEQLITEAKPKDDEAAEKKPDDEAAEGEKAPATKKPTRGISVKDLLLEVIRTMMGNKPVTKQQEVIDMEDERVLKAISAEFPEFATQIVTIFESGDNLTKKSTAIDSAVAGLSERIEKNLQQSAE